MFIYSEFQPRSTASEIQARYLHICLVMDSKVFVWLLLYFLLILTENHTPKSFYCSYPFLSREILIVLFSIILQEDLRAMLDIILFKGLFFFIFFFRNSMRADSIATSNIKNRIGSKGSSEKVVDVRLLLEEKRQHNNGPRQQNSTVKSGNLKLMLCGIVTGLLKLIYSHFTFVLYCDLQTWGNCVQQQFLHLYC